MPDERESSFKVTDRRKFNADGSPRDQVAQHEMVQAANESPEPQPGPAEPSNAFAASGSSNVVSFPGEAAKNGENTEAPSIAPPSAPAPGTDPTEAREPAAGGAEAAQDVAEQAFNKAAGPRPTGVPEGSFLNLLNMLAVEAAMHLGMIQPQGQEPLPVDLESARHLIDMLGMLQAKTRGNLTAEEDSLLENILADLRMQFVGVSKGR
jgi:hypothetical protein